VRTGDLARRAPSGRIVIIGRKDRMVKIRGQRVEPALVEAAMLRVPGVGYASVQVQRGGADARLIGFVVPERGAVAVAAAVEQTLRATLPQYMRPARVIEIGALPLGASGKIDTAALLQTAKEDAVQPPAEQAAHARASADAERAVAIAWRRVLGVMPAPGVTFLDAAGDSLRLLELVFDLESRTGRRLRLDAFSAHASAAEMALALDAALRNPTWSSASSRVFLLPGARGDTPGLAALRADCLPVAAMEMLTYPDWREMLRARLTMEGIIEAAILQIRALSPEGPVCLIGYSFGVHVAFDAACILETQGREVAQLVLIDMPPPKQRNREKPAWSARAMTREVWWEMDRLRRALREGSAAERFGMIAAAFATRLVGRSGIRTLAMSRATTGWSRHFGDLGYWTRHHMGQEFRLQAAHEWALRWRAPATRLRAPLLLIRTAAHRQDPREDLGWSILAEQVEVAHVQGTHVSVLSAAHRKAVSDAVGAALARALPARPDGPPERMSGGS
jgi:thioesterase domain-containing protein